MTSRLDRLFVLLETGSSPATRRAAAKQLGEVQRMYPHELHELLSRISSYLKSATWETRIAAGQAIEAVLRNLPPWDPIGILENDNSKQNSQAYKREFFRFHNFNVERIMAQSACLMASLGTDFDFDLESESNDQKEDVARQRKQLHLRLGLDDATASAMGFQLSDLVSDEDFTSQNNVSSEFSNHSNNIKKSVSEVLGEQSSCSTFSEKSGSLTLSSREANRARRKARQLSGVKSQKSRDLEDTGACSDDMIDRKKIKLEDEHNGSMENQQNEIFTPQIVENMSCVPDETGSWNTTSNEWPLHRFCVRLYCDLFSTQWETRHGAATALREIVRAHGAFAGKPADVSKKDMNELHELWLEDLSLRLLCVLALDRFGDFVSDQVVAPVRETCAQALGSVLHLMNGESVLKVLDILLSLLTQTPWEARHGGLLGLKYMLAVKQEMASLLLSRAFTPILNALSDEVDDVGAVAAAALTPVAPRIPHLLPIELMVNTVDTLWNLLLEQQKDDLAAAACNGFMGLLAALVALPEAGPCIKPKLMTELIPRLWPFIWHANSSVRRATLQALSTLAAATSFCWPAMPLLQDALRHLFQRALVESSKDIQQLVEKVWGILIRTTDLEALLVASCPMFSTWLCLAVQPARTPFDPSVLVQLPIIPPSSTQDKNSPSKKQRSISSNSIDSNNPLPVTNKLFIGGSESVPQTQRDANVLPARCMAARMLGLLSSYIVRRVPGTDYSSCEEPIEAYSKVVLVFINSKSAVQRCVAGLVLGGWAESEESSLTSNLPPPSLVKRLHQCLSEIVYWDEIAVNFTKLLQEARDFVATLKHYKLDIDYEKFSKVLTLEQMKQLTGPVWQGLAAHQKLKPKVLTSLEERRRSIQSAITLTSQEHLLHTLQTQSSIAGAVTRLNILPEKLNPVILPLMESLKKEEKELLQELSAKHLARLMELCLPRDPCPNQKIIQNLCTFLRADPEFSPKILKPDEIVSSTPSTSNSNPPVQLPPLIGAPSFTNYAGILTLAQRQRSAERAALFRRSNSTGGTSSSGRGPGRPPLTAAADLCLEEMLIAEDLANKQNRIQRRGAAHALTAITSHFGSNIPEKLPKLWELIVGKIETEINPETFDPSTLVGNDTAADELVSTLHILEVTAAFIHKDLLPKIISTIPSRFTTLLRHPYRAVRHMASRGLASLAKLGPIGSVAVMTECLRTVLPLLDDASNDLHRQGAVEALSCISETLHVDIVPYVVLLIVPLLGRMSDQNEPVRLAASQCFATLVRLVPLDGAIPEPVGLPAEIIERRDRERGFLHRLLHPAAIEDYRIPITIQADLRSYQQAGVNWLAFLNKYKLHGILCDDMGLGKTLQSICILAGDHYYRDVNYKLTKSPDCVPLPSLVICPPTITGHWVDEVNKFVNSDCLRAIQYVGTPLERIKLRNKLKKFHLIVASYDVVRKDIEYLCGINWNYCILDEGHVIKNGKTKSCIAIKMLTANHRLILSGTPIQNNVLELWSLFDFLMPGFLGTEKQFTARYSKPILASRDSKCSPKEQEAGALAMESLHRQVLPFLLRRMKEDVLKDLPPKITQDYYCDLSRIQEELYEDFSRSRAHFSLQEQIVTVGSTSSMQANTHIFQALRYLQNVCNHPKLVLQPNHPQYERIMKKINENGTLGDMSHAAKLPALKQLLLDCGIGVPVDTVDTSVVSQHRALIFCQLKTMLNILENDLFKTHMPTVSYLRLDGSIPPSARHNVVTRFNNDPSIDVLLLTTQVGGLGLNLTGADTVIFVEHDWNPMKDLQAMDRAHRIGQRKVVNVYRLITRGTLEEKIMGLQKFKMLTANTVITKENGSLDTMGTDQLLELFTLKDQPQQRVLNSSGITMRTVLNSLPELWEDKQYEEEYDLSNFMRGLQHQN